MSRFLVNKKTLLFVLLSIVIVVAWNANVYIKELQLYDLSEGITQTLIKEGFVESYISHNDTNISPKKLMQYLHDHFEAMDFIFDIVNNFDFKKM